MPKSSPIIVEASDLRRQRKKEREETAVAPQSSPFTRAPQEAKGICRICGSSQYIEIIVAVGSLFLGGKQPTKLERYECFGCSTHFSNPDLFFAEV